MRAGGGDRAAGPGDRDRDGAGAAFQLAKAYGDAAAVWTRTIAKPVAGTVQVAVAGEALAPAGFSVDATTGVVTLPPPRPRARR